MKSYTEVLAFRKQAELTPAQKRKLYEQKRVQELKQQGIGMATAPLNALLGSGPVVKAKSLFDRGTGAVNSAASGAKDIFNVGRQAINTQMQRVGEGAVNKLYGNAVSAAAAKPADKGEEALYNQAQNWSLIGQGLTGVNKVIGADKTRQNLQAAVQASIGQYGKGMLNSALNKAMHPTGVPDPLDAQAAVHPTGVPNPAAVAQAANGKANKLDTAVAQARSMQDKVMQEAANGNAMMPGNGDPTMDMLFGRSPKTTLLPIKNPAAVAVKATRAQMDRPINGPAKRNLAGYGLPTSAQAAPQYGNIDWGKTALPGLALGGGSALVAALLSGKKNKGRNALLAALIGGGIGVGGSALWQRYGQPKSASVKQAGLKEWWAKNSPAAHMKNIHNAGVDFKSDFTQTAGNLINDSMNKYMVERILPELPGIEPITPMVAGALGGGTSAILAALLSKKNKGRNAILAGTAGALGGAGIAAGTQGVDKIRGIWMLAKDKVRRQKEVKDAVAEIQAGKI